MDASCSGSGWSVPALELLAIVLAAERWGSSWGGKVVLFITDSETVALALQKNYCRAWTMNLLLRRINHLGRCLNFTFVTVWRRRVHNKVADALADGNFAAASVCVWCSELWQ